MKIFITGTDTNIGKTVISSWLCLKSGYQYFKPIQTGAIELLDSDFGKKIAKVTTHKESYIYQAPLSPHLAAKLENQEINIKNIKLPKIDNLIIEGAGGVLVPINRKFLMIDLIKQLKVPVIIVSPSRLGTINHTLLTIKALNLRKIEILGVIMNGASELDKGNIASIESYGKVKVLSSFPSLKKITNDSLKSVGFNRELQNLLSK
jgi:dethiobiotin synthetase